jgi:hypothetical protein
MELEVFLQLFSKLILKLVLSFMNRKSSCGYATHFFIILLILCVFERKEKCSSDDDVPPFTNFQVSALLSSLQNK